MDKLKDLIKQVAPMGVPPYGIHESQVIRRLFFQQPSHVEYSENLIEYEITKLKNDEDVLQVLIQSNYWKRFYPIEILVIFNKPVTEMEEDMAQVQHLLEYR